MGKELSLNRVHLNTKYEQTVTAYHQMDFHTNIVVNVVALGRRLDTDSSVCGDSR